MLKFKFHSIVDLITNSSTVIFTYQNSIKEAKELIAEILKLSGSDKTPDDVFYYGVFCGSDEYLDDIEDTLDDEVPDDLPSDVDWKRENELREEWINSLISKIIKEEIKKPDWMEKCETNYDDYHYSTYLYLIPKDDKYNELGDKIRKLLGSVSGDGYRDG